VDDDVDDDPEKHYSSQPVEIGKPKAEVDKHINSILEEGTGRFFPLNFFSMMIEYEFIHFNFDTKKWDTGRIATDPA